MTNQSPAEASSGLESADRALRAVTDCLDAVFDGALVMSHAIDENGFIKRVNPRWLQTLGYEREEVLGRRSVEFLNEESRRRAIADILPLMWRVGALRSVGYDFVKKDGSLLNVLLDAELVLDPGGGSTGIGVMHESDDPSLWQYSRVVLSTMRDLCATTGSLRYGLSAPAADHERMDVLQAAGDALDIGRDVASNLRAMLRSHEEWSQATQDQQRDLLLVARNIDRSLRDLADTAAEQSALH